MQFRLAPLDWLNILYLPLMITTGRDVLRQKESLFDSDLTLKDRYLLQRLVIFVLLPVVVFCHELGHVLAIKLCHGEVQEFHYAFVWGYVVPSGQFSSTQTVWMYLAGNLVQIIIGLIALLAAWRAKTPPMVALLTYLGLWSIGGTVILYTLMSFSGFYGDWLAIYTLAKGPLWLGIATAHLLLVGLMLWLLYSTKARVWFTSHTQPSWLEEQKRLWTDVKVYPGAINWLNLGWSYQLVALNGKARECLKKAKAYSPEIAEASLLEASLLLKDARPGQATALLQRLLERTDLKPSERYRGLLCLADCQIKSNQPQLALNTYQQAAELMPALADPRYLHALLLNNLGQKPQALSELMVCLQLQWQDRELQELAIQSWQQLHSQAP